MDTILRLTNESKLALFSIEQEIDQKMSFVDVSNNPIWI